MLLKNLLAAAAALVVSVPAFASYRGPLLSVHMHSGHSPAQYGYSIVCEIYPNKVVTKQFFGATSDASVGAVETKTIKLEGNIGSLIAKAAEEPTDETPAPCDIPTRDVTAYQIQPNDAVVQIVLSSSGGCSEPRVERKGPASFILDRFVAAHCPTTAP